MSLLFDKHAFKVPYVITVETTYLNRNMRNYNIEKIFKYFLFPPIIFITLYRSTLALELKCFFQNMYL